MVILKSRKDSQAIARETIVSSMETNGFKRKVL